MLRRADNYAHTNCDDGDDAHDQDVMLVMALVKRLKLLISTMLSLVRAID